MRKLLSLAISIALLLTGGSAIAAIPDTAAQKSVRDILSGAPLRSGLYGVLAVRMNGDTLVCINPSQKLVPASNMKVITTGLALASLGEDYRYETQIAYTGSIVDSTLVGNVYILGGGDPTTASKFEKADRRDVLFSRWHKILRNAGINAVDGMVIGDPRYFMGATTECPGWLYEDIGSYYGASPLGLNFYENTQTFQVTPGPSVGSAPYIVPRYPDTPWMQYSHTAKTSGKGSTNELLYECTPFGPYGSVRGSFPIDRKGYTLETANRFGAYTCAYLFCRYLSARGVRVSGGHADVSPRGYIRRDLSSLADGAKAASRNEMVVVGSTYSPRLSDIVEQTNHQSDNFFAETLFKTLGKTSGEGCEYEDCRKAVLAALKSMGLRPEGYCRVYDGSGLSRKNYVCPSFFVSFLRKMAASPVANAFKESLPQPGEVQTTMEFRLRLAPEDLKSRIWMKSGSMDGVACLCGYIDTPDGDPRHTVVFSVMTNNNPVHSHTVYALIDDIVAAIAAEN